MNNFRISFPTEIYFGKGQTKVVAKEVKKYGARVLLVYGKGSIKKNGIYDEVTSQLKEGNIFYKELGGVDPNPRISTVKKGADICRSEHIDFVLAVGAGSVIDCAKAIAAARYYSNDPWDIFIRKTSIKKALPVGVVLTLAATGSETNAAMVISNEETKEKRATGSLRLKPKFAVIDPQHTYSVPAKHTSAGIADIMSHVFEQYFSTPENTFVQDRMAEAIISTCIKYGPVALQQPDSYEARSNILWAGTIALNGLLGAGKDQDWATHMIEHEVSAIYDVTHGVGLAILTPHYMKYILDDKNAARFATYGRNIFGIIDNNDMTCAHKAIEQTATFFESLDIPMSLSKLGIDDSRFNEMAEKATLFGDLGNYKTIAKYDIISILKAAL